MSKMTMPPDLGSLADGEKTPKTHTFDLSFLERLLNASNDKLEVILPLSFCFQPSQPLPCVIISVRNFDDYAGHRHSPELLNGATPRTAIFRISCKVSTLMLAVS